MQAWATVRELERQLRESICELAEWIVNRLFRKVFAKNGYCVALIARRADLLEKTTKVVEEVGGEEVRGLISRQRWS